MTVNQLAYWTLEETKRSNRAHEDIGRKQAAASLSQASAAHRQADIAAERVLNDYTLGLRNATVNETNAAAKTKEAETNSRKADVMEKELALKQYDTFVGLSVEGAIDDLLQVMGTGAQLGKVALSGLN